jgi:iron complex outermembrane receptor protein
MNRKGIFTTRHCRLCMFSASLIWMTLPTAQAQQIAARDFLHLSIEELSSIKISSVSKQEQSLSGAPASIFVITRQDIHDSGANTIPEALRLAPNLQVARAGAGHYAISARGFNNAIGNKLLVLIDGRTVYSPVFSGVFWDQQEIMLEDVERIEVISGPGGTLWGSNAVNGVINIITRSATDTQGALATAGGGNIERAAAARYGAALGDNGHYRVYAKGTESDHTQRTDGTAVDDAFERTQAGFRFDLDDGKNTATLQSDAYDGTLGGDLADDELRFNGGNVLGRYTRRFLDDSEFMVQGYFDQAVRENDNLLGIPKDKMTILDTELQYTLPPIGSNRILLGAGYRKAEDRIDNGPDPEPVEITLQTLFMPEDKDLKWRNLFIQDEIALSPELALTLGGKWEKNIYTDTEFLPNLRLAWQPASDHLLWGALSRAVRAPARLDRDFHLRAVVPEQLVLLGFPSFINFINGGPNFESEISDVAEIGWRAQPSASFSYSATVFYSEHDNLRSGEPAPVDLADNPLGTAFFVSNTIEGSSKGVEAWANWQITDWWLLSGGLTELRQDLRNKPGSLDPEGPRALGNDPEHTSMLRSTFSINDDQRLHLMARHVSELPDPKVPSFTAVDMRYGWEFAEGFELSLLLQNMFDTAHVEFYGDTSDNPTLPVEYERGAFLKLTWTN